MTRETDLPLVTVVGGANIDIHGKPDAPLRAHDSNPGTIRISPGGVARNVAENLARLGIRCRLVSAVGNDGNGDAIVNACRAAGVDVRHLHRIEPGPTPTYLSILDDSGDLHIAVNDMRLLDRLDADRLEAQRAVFAESSLVIVDANLPADTLEWITGICSDVPLFADAVSAQKAGRLRPFLQSIHTLKCSELEARALAGQDDTEPAEPGVLADCLRDKSAGRVFVSRGGKGVCFSTPEQCGSARQRNPEPRRPENASGAGDAFLAGLAFAWLESWPLDRSLEFALSAAELTLAVPGACNPSLSITAIESLMESDRAKHNN
jgi:pseudouridine kinase